MQNSIIKRKKMDKVEEDMENKCQKAIIKHKGK